MEFRAVGRGVMDYRQISGLRRSREAEQRNSR